MEKKSKTNGIYLKYMFIFLSICLLSCESDDSTPSIPTGAEFEALREDALSSIIQEFQFNAEAGYTTFTSTKGVVIGIDGNCLTLSGNPITGAVDIEFVEIFDGGTMLATHKTTLGKLPNGDLAMLDSGGAFYINATKNGQQLAITCNISLTIPTSLTGGEDLAMTLWDGDIDAEGNLEWREQVPGTGGAGVEVLGQGTSSTYYALFSNFGWTNVDRFYNDPNPKTSILVAVPGGYGDQNCAVYLHYDGEGSSLANLDTYNSTTGQFSEHYGQVPIGLACHIIFASESNGQWRYGIKAVNITANAVYSFTLSQTSLGTEAQLIAAINALP
jgi:hypothetical protein